MLIMKNTRKILPQKPALSLRFATAAGKTQLSFPGDTHLLKSQCRKFHQPSQQLLHLISLNITGVASTPLGGKKFRICPTV